MVEVLTKTMMVIILQCTNVSSQQVGHLKLTQCYMVIIAQLNKF